MFATDEHVMFATDEHGDATTSTDVRFFTGKYSYYCKLF